MTSTQLTTLAQRDPIYCQVQRNCIWFHRNQMRFVADCMRNAGLPRPTGLRLMKQHAAEIKQVYAEIDFAAQRYL